MRACDVETDSTTTRKIRPTFRSTSSAYLITDTDGNGLGAVGFGFIRHDGGLLFGLENERATAAAA